MRLFLFVICIVLSVFVNAQETKFVAQELTRGHKESFYVQVKDSTKREGTYTAKFKKKRFCEGQYKEGERVGSWKFYNHKNGKLEYTYNYDLKQFEGPYTKYFENGRIELTANYVNGKREGEQRLYSEKGTLIDLWNFSNGKSAGIRYHYFDNAALNFELHYVNGSLDGSSKFYHRHNKQLLLDVVYTEGKLITVKSLNDSTGKALNPGTVTNGNGTRYVYFNNNVLRISANYQNGMLNGQYQEYRYDSTLFISGNYSNNKPTGVWQFFTRGGDEGCAYDYELDSMIRENKTYSKEMAFDESSRIYNMTKHRVKINDSILFNNPATEKFVPVFPPLNNYFGRDELSFRIESNAKFPGGDDYLLLYLIENIRYPSHEKENKIGGTVFISFIVEADGSITEIKPIKTVENGAGFTKEAIRVITMMPRWIPGMSNGRPVRVTCNVPIRFVIR